MTHMEKKEEECWKEKQVAVSKTSSAKKSDGYSKGEDIRLAALAIRLNIRLRSADMPAIMQERALRYTRSLTVTADHHHHEDDSSHRRTNPTVLARALKKEFDSLYGPAWHCVVGKSFGSFVTHSPGGFVYFSLDSLCFLLFKTEVQLV